jgi:putative hydrolase of the HAD superfamily
MHGPVTPRVVLFDLYRTLIDITTDERSPEVWRQLSRFLTYYDPARIAPEELSRRYFELAARQLRDSPEPHPEIDITRVFRDILHESGVAGADSLAAVCPRLLRVLSLRHFGTYPDVLPGLRKLRARFQVGVVSDAQVPFIHPEIASTGLAPLLDVVVVSGEHGIQKPDRRLFDLALERLGLGPEQAVYAGDNVDRDICGARAAGITAVLVDRRGRFDAAAARCRPDRVVGGIGELCEMLLDGDAG